MTQTLDNFLKLWKEERRAKAVNEILVKDPYDINAYNYIILKTTEIQGHNPTIGPDGNFIHLNPNEYRALGNAVYLTNKIKAVQFSKDNLEGILKETNDNQLVKITTSINPIHNNQYENIIEKIKEYQEINTLITAYKSGEEKLEKLALIEMYKNKKLINIIKEDLANMEKEGKKVFTNENEIAIWTNALLYITPTNPFYMIRGYQNKIAKLESEIKGFGRVKLINYTKETINANPEPDKEYEKIYEVLSS